MRTTTITHPRFLLLVVAAAIAATPALAADPAGYLDAADCTSIRGWAADPDNPYVPIAVHVYYDQLDAQHIFGFGADVPAEPGVCQAAGGVNCGVCPSTQSQCQHRFVHPTPDLLKDGRPHTLHAFAVNLDGTPGGNLQLASSPRVIQCNFELVSADGGVRVVVDPHYGGVITGLYDYTNMGSLNLVDGEQAGAMFQTAFWTLPWNTEYPGGVPPGCDPTRADMKLHNPTQAGFVADGHAGSPIGIMGTDATYPDPNELIRFEDDGRTLHLKTRIIRYDFCKSGAALRGEEYLWDSPFYNEQWLSFHPVHHRTLVMRSRLTNSGPVPQEVSTRLLPVIYTVYLPRLAYWANGQKVIQRVSVNTPFATDRHWAAMVAADRESGIGYVVAPTAAFVAGDGRQRFMGGVTAVPYVPTGEDNTLFFGSGLPLLDTLGATAGVTTSGHVEVFAPGASFEWVTYYPIGDLGSIKAAAEALLDDPGAWPGICADECAAGTARCSGAGVQLCGKSDADPCLEWGPVTVCPTGQVCTGDVCACESQCSLGARRCAGDGVETCVDQGGCGRWGAAVACPGRVGAWDSPVCSGVDRVVRSRTLYDGACAGGVCTEVGTVETEVVAVCPASTCDAWAPEQCGLGGVVRSRQCHDRSCAEGACVATLRDETELVAVCAADQVCEQGACVSGPPPQACEPGATRCQDDGVATCIEVDGSPRWSEVSACLATQFCREGLCTESNPAPPPVMIGVSCAASGPRGALLPFLALLALIARRRRPVAPAP